MKKYTPSKKASRKTHRASKKLVSGRRLSKIYIFVVILFFLLAAGSLLYSNSERVKAFGAISSFLTSLWQPPSPDPSGIAYNPATGKLIVVDGEVEEMPIYAGKNVFATSLIGVVQDTYTTTNFSNEPTDVAINHTNGHWFFTDDDLFRIFEVDLGTDGVFGTADDVRTSFSTTAYGNTDPEGITYGAGQLFVSDGVGDRVYTISPGTNGLFDGVAPGGDDQVTSFSTTPLAMNDPEGIAYNVDSGTLFIVSYSYKTRIVEASIAGALIRNIDTTALQATALAGVEYAPSSFDSTQRSLYMVDRGVDNNVDPNENDGRLYEFSLGTGVPPTPTPIPTPIPTPVPPTILPSVMTIPVLADTYVDATKPSTKYGSATKLYDDGSPVMIAYLKFDLRSLVGKTVNSAKLRFRVYNASVGTHIVKQVADTAWVEGTVSYSTRPALGSQITSFPKATLGAWVEADVTAYTATRAGQLMSLGLETKSSDAMGIYAKENAVDRPELVVSYQ